MAESLKERELAEVEGLLARYVHKYVNPEVVNRYRYLQEQHAKEHPESSAPIIGSVYGSAGMQSRDMSHFKPADTAGILEYVTDKVNNDPKTGLDMANIIEAWKAVYIKNYGKERYEEISKELGEDLATYYLNAQVRNMMLERLAKEKVPKSSLEYIAVAAYQSTLFGTALMAMTDDDKQKEFDMVRKLYNPSGGEKAAAEASAFAIDCLSLGPLAGLGKGAGITGKLAAKANYSIYSSKLASRFGTEFADKMLARGMKTEKWILTNMGRTEFLTAELAMRTRDIMKDVGAEDNKDLSKLLYGDEKAIDRMRSSAASKSLDSDIANGVNAVLSRKVITSISQDNIRRDANISAGVASGNGSTVLEYVRESLSQLGLAYLPQKKVPEWMKTKMNEATCTKNAGYFMAVASEMQAKGRDRMKLGSKEFTLKEVTQRAYDYARAADWFHQKNGLTETEKLERNLDQGTAELQAAGLLNADGSRVRDVNDSPILQNIRASLHKNGLPYIPEHSFPQFMVSMSQQDLEKSAKGWRNLAVKMQNEKKTEINVNGIGKMTLKEVTQRAYDYALCADLKFKEAKEAKLARQEQSQQLQKDMDQWDKDMAQLNSEINGTGGQQQTGGDPNLHQTALDISGSAGDPQQSMMHNAIITEQQGGQQPSQGQGGYQQQPLPQQMGYQPAQVLPNQQNVQGWGDMLENMGMGSLTRLGKGFGETLTVMPELMYGMFTGKIRNFRMEDNLLPLGLLMAGLFVSKRSHPILKLLLLALGGMLLLGNANDAVHGREKTQPQARPTYRRYEEEALDPRIRDPHVIGNTLVAEVDGHHLVLTINEDQVLDAYGKGVIPLNNLCNAALRSYDEQGGVAARYEREMALTEKQEEERVRGLR